jgi:8-oxo-dGTP pyrophosphatase MutT (NUDIX family)
MSKNILSVIQNNIISKLKNAKALKYGELYSKKIPNDLFNYHLQHLVEKGFLIKNDSSYSLSDKGLKYIADPFTEDITTHSFFKVNVITIVSRIVNGKIEILNQLRKSNPSYGKIGVVGGVVLKGESIEDAASRKLKQETGLEAKFKVIGYERRIMYKKGELFSDLIFPIAYTDKSSGDLIKETDFGENFWVSIDKAMKNESGDFDTIKSINTVLKAVKKGELKKLPMFFVENTQSDGVD